MPFVFLTDQKSTHLVKNQMNAAGKFQQNVLLAAQIHVYIQLHKFIFRTAICVELHVKKPCCCIQFAM